jgi:hypothetical protein
MRRLCAAAVLLISVHGASAGELDFMDRMERLGLDTDASLLAFAYFDCTQSAAKEAASRDRATPASIMVEWAAGEAAKQCEAGGNALAAAVGQRQASTIKALVREANVETALAVRKGEPPYLCADGRGCPVTRTK